MTRTRWMIAAVVVAIGAVPAVATADVAIEDVTVRAASQIDGAVYALDALPKADGGTYEFGGDMDLVVAVLVSATAAKTMPVEVVLSAPARKTQAGTKIKAIKAKQKRTLFLAAGSKRWLLYVFDYPCAPATVTVKAGKAQKRIVNPA
jgi:hypothetical protein